METIKNALESTEGYITSFKRNSVEGWWEVEIGLPITWVFNDNKNITCKVLDESEIGKLINISPKNLKTTIDDLVQFIEIIIETNGRIAEKEKEFTDKMDDMKNKLEEEAKKFYTELDDLKEKSFKHFDKKQTKSSKTNVVDKKKTTTTKAKAKTTVATDKEVVE